MKPSEFFDWQFWRFAYAADTYWVIASFEDGSVYWRVMFGLYWREKP